MGISWVMGIPPSNHPFLDGIFHDFFNHPGIGMTAVKTNNGGVTKILPMTLPHKSFVRWSPAWSRGMFKNHPCPQGKDAFLSGNSSGKPMLNSIPACYSSVTEAAEKKKTGRRSCLPGDPCRCFHFVQGIISFGWEELLPAGRVFVGFRHRMRNAKSKPCDYECESEHIELADDLSSDSP